MAATPGQISDPVLVGDGAIVFSVTSQKKVTPQELADNATAYSDALRTQQARSLRMVLLQRLRKGAEVEINQQVLQTATSQSSV
jgi:hypothetical protein